MAGVKTTSAAARDLLEIGRYIASESSSLEIALKFLDKVDEKCRLYSTQPVMAGSRPDLGKDVHSFPVGDYVVVYRSIEDGIIVLLVIHGSRDVPNAMHEKMQRRPDMNDE